MRGEGAGARWLGRARAAQFGAWGACGVGLVAHQPPPQTSTQTTRNSVLGTCGTYSCWYAYAYA